MTPHFLASFFRLFVLWFLLFCFYCFFGFIMFFRASCPLGTPHGMPITLFLGTPVASFFGVSYFGCVYRCLHTQTPGPVDASLSCKLVSPFSFVVFTFLFLLLFYIYYVFRASCPLGTPHGMPIILFLRHCVASFFCVSSFQSVYRPQDFPKNPQEAPERPHKGPKSDPEGPKRHPREPN